MWSRRRPLDRVERRRFEHVELQVGLFGEGGHQRDGIVGRQIGAVEIEPEQRQVGHHALGEPDDQRRLAHPSIPAITIGPGAAAVNQPASSVSFPARPEAGSGHEGEEIPDRRRSMTRLTSNWLDGASASCSEAGARCRWCLKNPDLHRRERGGVKSDCAVPAPHIIWSRCRVAHARRGQGVVLSFGDNDAFR